MMYKLFRVGILFLYVFLISWLGNIFGAVLLGTAPYSFFNGMLVVFIHEFIKFVANGTSSYALHPLIVLFNHMFGLDMDN